MWYIINCNTLLIEMCNIIDKLLHWGGTKLNKFEVTELELAREVIRELGREIEKSQLPESEMDLKLDSLEEVEKMIIKKLRDLLK